MNTQLKTYFIYIGSIILKRTMCGRIHAALNDQVYTSNCWYYPSPFNSNFETKLCSFVYPISSQSLERYICWEKN